MDPEYERFLSRLRNLAGKNVSAFARKIGLNQSVVYRYLQGQLKPGFEFFRRLDRSRINLHCLFSGEGEPYLSSGRRCKAALYCELETLDEPGKLMVRDFIASYKKARKKGTLR